MEINIPLYKADDNFLSLGYSANSPTSNYYYPNDDYPIAKNKKPHWLIQAEEDQRLFQEWLQKKQRFPAL